MSPTAPGRSELHERQHESRPPRVPLRPAELAAIIAFWLFFAVLNAAGRLIDPRIPGLRPEVTRAVLTLSFIEYAIWALLTVPVVWLVHRFTISSSQRAPRLLLFLAVGVVLAILVDTIVSQFRVHLLPPPPGRPPRGMFTNIIRFEFLDDFMVYLAVLGAALARDYFLRYQARLEETTRLQSQTARLEAQLAEARLDALRTQLNPHFLFNTLNAVSTLVERDPRGVRRMIARLSELLRHTLDETDEQEIPLERELDLLRRYLEIMEIRFQGRLTVMMDIADDVREALVPNLVLQPLVENALKHGLSASDGSGRVEVSARRDGDVVRLEVRDHGPGPVAPKDSSGVGIKNTIARLEQLYGSKQRFTLRAAEGGGAVAEVELPYHEVSVSA
ncbi:MAG TPA: histidine kinase [Gemmatimonadaceae bacterium]